MFCYTADQCMFDFPINSIFVSNGNRLYLYEIQQVNQQDLELTYCKSLYNRYSMATGAKFSGVTHSH